MESEGCAVLSQPKLRRHKVSAFRDFPLGCGPCASMNPNRLENNENLFPLAIDDEPPEEATAATSAKRFSSNRRVSAVRDFPPLCGKNANLPLCKVQCVKGVSSLDQHQQHIDANQVKKNDQDGCTYNGRLRDMVQGDSEGNFRAIPEERDCRHWAEMNLERGHEGNGDAAQFAGTLGQEIVVYQEVQDVRTKPLDVSSCRHEPKRGPDRSWVASRRIVVQALMAESECPWRSADKRKGKGKKVGFRSPNHSGKPLQKKKGNGASEATGQLIIWENKDSLHTNGNTDEFEVVKKSHGSNVNGPSFDQCGYSYGHQNNDANVTRKKVRETLFLFQAVSRNLLRKEESKLNEESHSSRGIDLQAAKILKESGKYLHTGKKILGSVPGVDVGDEFQYRVELNIVGLHQQIQGDIDYVKHNGKILATSVVTLAGYADELDYSDVLIYTGLSENVTNTDKEFEDGKLEWGNLAINNSIEEKNPVRVIRCSESMDGKCKIYVYEGLYVVETCWQDKGPHGELVLRFRLRRIPGQPDLARKEVKKSDKFKTREFLCVDDISDGKEPISVGALNTIDDEPILPFEYVTRMIYPNWCNPIPPLGCDCAKGCSNSRKCCCTARNGGDIPFNHDGAIVEAKPLVYECGPSCKCPPTCYNRVSQHGIKFQLEIFKTESRGWGVRSLNSIPSGSFICEYIGELLGEDEAEERVGNDEYLFDIGNNYSKHSLWDGLSAVMPDAQSTSCEALEGSIFTIDALRYGNVGRFVNHSCSPNLYAQNVLYDHDDKRIPHIMLFAAENIPPLQELTYDYNYTIDQVYDSDGNVKKKDCYCGSVECTGRMY